MSPGLPTFADVRAAAERIAPHIARTPCVQLRELDALLGTRTLIKCEHRQHTGSFKYRGASNAVWSLTDDEATRGVATHSSGNHGQALARAARSRGISCHVVMPHDSTGVKRDGVVANGATVIPCEPTMDARVAGLEQVVAATGATPIHPFSNPHVIAGQGTATLELLEEFPDLDVIVTPVGGGGLICGTALAAHGRNPMIRIVGAEPEGARDTYDSLTTGVRVTQHTPDTICDGLRGTVGEINLEIMHLHAVDVRLVSDDEVRAAMDAYREVTGEAIEPSSAAALAVIARCPELFADCQTGVILTGGNVDPAPGTYPAG